VGLHPSGDASESARQSVADDTYAVTAFLLNRNKIIEANDVMSKESLPKVRMPNQDGFIPMHGQTLERTLLLLAIAKTKNLQRAEPCL